MRLAQSKPLQWLMAAKMVNAAVFQGKSVRIDDVEMPLHFHSYNNYGLTERVLEIPLIQRYLQELPTSSRVLEIGNVTNYYYDVFGQFLQDKTVVDKFEVAQGVISRDIADFEDPNGYDFIFSISTFEHMDSDQGRNPDFVAGTSKDITHALDNIRHVYENLLNKGGRLLITAPLGYTTEWDQTFWVLNDRFPAVRRCLFLRKGPLEFEQIAVLGSAEKQSYPYGTPWPYANCVSLVELSK